LLAISFPRAAVERVYGSVGAVADKAREAAFTAAFEAEVASALFWLDNVAAAFAVAVPTTPPTVQVFFTLLPTSPSIADHFVSQVSSQVLHHCLKSCLHLSFLSFFTHNKHSTNSCIRRGYV
jgi:hypothetical protein